VILISADVAAMAPGTETGAAHPVLIGGGEMSKTMTEKVVNDAAAYVRSLAEKRNRDSQAAESAIRESRSFTDREALDKRLIEIVARDEWDLLAQLNGRAVTRFDGSQKVLQTANEKLTPIIPTFRQRLLIWLADPRIAFVLFAIGMLCVYFEFQHPGIIAPGVVGALAMVLALYGFHMLPINVTGALLIVVALALFVLEAKVQGFGLLGLGGVVAAVIGSLILIDVPCACSGHPVRADSDSHGQAGAARSPHQSRHGIGRDDRIEGTGRDGDRTRRPRLRTRRIVAGALPNEDCGGRERARCRRGRAHALR
jgi:membrane-bound serine protease (ClpP class)